LKASFLLHAHPAIALCAANTQVMVPAEQLSTPKSRGSLFTPRILAQRNRFPPIRIRTLSVSELLTGENQVSAQKRHATISKVVHKEGKNSQQASADMDKYTEHYFRRTSLCCRAHRCPTVQANFYFLFPIYYCSIFRAKS
jgi:hypothetical protein